MVEIYQTTLHLMTDKDLERRVGEVKAQGFTVGIRTVRLEVAYSYMFLGLFSYVSRLGGFRAGKLSCIEAATRSYRGEAAGTGDCVRTSRLCSGFPQVLQ